MSDLDEEKLARSFAAAFKQVIPEIRKTIPEAIKESGDVIHPQARGWAYVSSLGLKILETQGVATLFAVCVMIWLGFVGSPKMFEYLDKQQQHRKETDAAMIAAVQQTNEKLDHANAVMSPLGAERKTRYEESKKMQEQHHGEIVTALSGMQDDVITAEVRDKLIAFAERWDDATREDFDKLMSDVAELLKNMHSHEKDNP
jgi:hypothetical protein